MNNYIVKARPQLVRKNTHISVPTVSVLARPNQRQLRPLPQLVAKPRSEIPIKNAEVAQSALQSAISRRQLIKQRRHKLSVKHVSPDIGPDALYKISKIRNSGVGKILVIVGNGPSILDIDAAKLKNHKNIRIMSINTPDSRLWPTDYWTFFDLTQFRRHEDLWNSFDGIIFNSTAIKRQKPTSMQFKNIHGKGWSHDLKIGLHIGRSSVFASMQIAQWLGFEHVYIIGCDMNRDGIDGKLHFYGKNPDVDPSIRRERFAKEAEYYDAAAAILTPDERQRFTFCSTYNDWDFTNKFNKMSHHRAINHIIEHGDRLDKVL